MAGSRRVRYMPIMGTAMIDTLEASETLTGAGLPPEHARAIARLLSGAHIAAREDLPTKADLDNAILTLRAEVTAGNNAIRAEISGIDVALRADHNALGVTLRAEMKTLNAELKADMVRWLVGSQVGLVIALVALAKSHIFG